jgi:hypothetical protein
LDVHGKCDGGIEAIIEKVFGGFFADMHTLLGVVIAATVAGTRLPPWRVAECSDLLNLGVFH